MAIDYTTWMPASLSAGDKAEFVAAATYSVLDYDTGEQVEHVDHHLAAALAWEHYVALGAGSAEQTAPDVETLSTGTQTVGFGRASNRQAAAAKRAAWHRARSRARSVVVAEPLIPEEVEAT